MRRDEQVEIAGAARPQVLGGLALFALALVIGGVVVFGPRDSSPLELASKGRTAAGDSPLRPDGGQLPAAHDATQAVERATATSEAPEAEVPSEVAAREAAPEAQPRKSGLTVCVLDSRRVPAEGATVEVTASGPAQEQPFPRRSRTEWNGRVTLDPPRAVPLRLRVLGRVDDELLAERDLAAFEADESREIEIVLPIVTRELVVRVVDELGEPVADAMLMFAGDGFREFWPMKGRELLHCGAVECDTISLGVFAAGFTPFRRDGIAVPIDGSPIELVLQRGLSLRVEVVDEDGRPVTDVQAKVRNQGALQGGRDLGSGAFDFCELPDRELELVVEVGGRAYERRVHPSVGRLEVVVPVHGKLEVDWVMPESCKTGKALLTLQSISDAADTTRQHRMLEGQSGRAHFDAVLPGRHHIFFQPYGEDPGVDLEFEPRVLEIEARRTTTVAL